MPSRNSRAFVYFALLSLLLSGSTLLQAQTPIRSDLIVSGLSRPVFATSPAGDFERLFIAEQRGSASTANRADIRIMDLNTQLMRTKPFLTISPVRTSSEEGLLGLGVPPQLF